MQIAWRMRQDLIILLHKAMGRVLSVGCNSLNDLYLWAIKSGVYCDIST